jgi:uncharacterized protein (TIGR03083 family)
MTSTRLVSAVPRRSVLPRDQAMQLAGSEYERFVAAISELSADDWGRRTVCAEWNVQQMVAHVVGMAFMATSPLEQRRQHKAALARRTDAAPYIDWLTAYQVDRFAGEPPGELVRLAEEVAPRAARGRKRVPGFIRRRPMPVEQLVGGVAEPWTIGFLVDTILTRDTWMHRSDIAHATDRPMQVTAEHDGVIVADVVHEWAGRHGAAYRLTLTGAAGGTWSSVGSRDTEPEQLTLDAVDFCRAVSGRSHASGLLATQVPF